MLCKSSTLRSRKTLRPDLRFGSGCFNRNYYILVTCFGSLFQLESQEFILGSVTK